MFYSYTYNGFANILKTTKAYQKQPTLKQVCKQFIINVHTHITPTYLQLYIM